MTAEASFFGLTDKKAMVIGGGQGMGESTSRFLARAGCDVAVIDKERDRAERVACVVGALGRRGVPIIGEVLDDATEGDKQEPGRNASRAR
jgi:3-oxoacyl-[acyl-carrier protein] reductase